MSWGCLHGPYLCHSFLMQDSVLVTTGEQSSNCWIVDPSVASAQFPSLIGADHDDITSHLGTKKYRK